MLGGPRGQRATVVRHGSVRSSTLPTCRVGAMVSSRSGSGELPHSHPSSCLRAFVRAILPHHPTPILAIRGFSWLPGIQTELRSGFGGRVQPWPVHCRPRANSSHPLGDLGALGGWPADTLTAGSPRSRETTAGKSRCKSRAERSRSRARGAACVSVQHFVIAPQHDRNEGRTNGPTDPPFP